MDDDDDIQQQECISERMADLLIPEGPCPAMTGETLNYFNYSPQGKQSHSEPEKGCNSEETEVHEAGMGFLFHCA